MKAKLFVVALLLSVVFAPTVYSQHIASYLQKHAAFVGGVVIVDAQKEKLVELRVTDDFPAVEKVRISLRASLFSITRAGETIPDPRIPLTLEQAKAYSDGEGWISLYRPVTPNVAVECTAGVTFKMISITGQVGDPLDGTKLAGACGVRASEGDYNVSVLAGHFGPVVEDAHVAGFVPSVLIRAHIPLRFLGKTSSFVPDLAFGKQSNGEFSRSLRLGIATRF